jgi:hypothetical protein
MSKQIFLEMRDLPLSEVSWVVQVSFLLGQRTSDVLQLQTRDVEKECVKGQELMVFVFRRGKVVPKIGPFCVAMPLVENLWNFVKEKKAAQATWLILGGNDEDHRLFWERKLEKFLEQWNLKVRSVRRGGLQEMAKAGVPLDDILLFSKHTSLSMLFRYLDAGAKSAHHTTTTAQVVKSVFF